MHESIATESLILVSVGLDVNSWRRKSGARLHCSIKKKNTTGKESEREREREKERKRKSQRKEERKPTTSAYLEGGVKHSRAAPWTDQNLKASHAASDMFLSRIYLEGYLHSLRQGVNGHQWGRIKGAYNLTKTSTNGRTATEILKHFPQWFVYIWNGLYEYLRSTRYNTHLIEAVNQRLAAMNASYRLREIKRSRTTKWERQREIFVEVRGGEWFMLRYINRPALHRDRYSLFLL